MRDIDIAAEALANDPSLTDYQCWRMLKNVNYDLYSISAANNPIPIRLVRLRAVLMRVSEARCLAYGPLEPSPPRSKPVLP
jgi:hypothetical protein